MKLEQKLWTRESGWENTTPLLDGVGAQLVLAFGAREEIENPERFQELQSWYPRARIIMASSAGEILGTQVRDDSISVTAIYFEKTTFRVEDEKISSIEDSEAIGQKLAGKFHADGLKYVLVLSEGLRVNGSFLVEGLRSTFPKDVLVTGGLVGDKDKFERTVVGVDGKPDIDTVVAIGFYGNSLMVRHGSMGGWDPFGPKRLITKSSNNILYELDDKPALDLYKEYLGEEAAHLPGSGLLFPLNLHTTNDDGKEASIVRTLLSVDEKSHSMTFAGNLPEGSYVSLMKANFERLVDGAANAATKCLGAGDCDSPDFALLISCIGRKLILKDRVEEETEAVEGILHPKQLAGFYSYGEISPLVSTTKKCELLNQTMTITTFKEV